MHIIFNRLFTHFYKPEATISECLFLLGSGMPTMVSTRHKHELEPTLLGVQDFSGVVNHVLLDDFTNYGSYCTYLTGLFPLLTAPHVW